MTSILDHDHDLGLVVDHAEPDPAQAMATLTVVPDADPAPERSRASDPHAGAIRPVALRPAPARATRLDLAARRVLLRLLEHLHGGRLTIVEHDGTVTTHGRIDRTATRST